MAFALAAMVSMFVQQPAAHAAGADLSLAEALRLAVAQSPQLAAQRATIDATQQGSVAAGALPNPRLYGMVENIPYSSSEAWTLRDPMTMLMIGVIQDVPGGDKRKLRSQRAEQDALREGAMLDVQRVAVQRETAMAWMARRFADDVDAIVAAQIAEAEILIATSGAAYRAGRVPQGDVIAAQSALIELKNRRTEVGAQAKRARIALARYIGIDAERPPGDAPDLTRLPGGVADLVDGDALPEARAAKAQEAVATTDAALAREESTPDWSIEFAYGFRGRAAASIPLPFHPVEAGVKYPDMLTLRVAIDLPLFAWRHQNPKHVAKLRELDAARAAREETRRRQSAEVQGMVADWDSARAQAARIREDLIPLTIQRREAAFAAYRGGTGALVAVLEARRAELDAQLALAVQEQAAAKAWAWLAFVFPVAEKS